MVPDVMFFGVEVTRKSLIQCLGKEPWRSKELIRGHFRA
jgi:hypothetical protein